MPIARALRHLYRTPEWKAAHAAVMTRAAQRCEWCGKPNRAVVRGGPYRGVWYDEPARTWRDRQGAYAAPPKHTTLVQVQLGVAHLDHDPTHNDLDNLAALCRRCHLVYDGPHHRRTARLRRDAQTGQMRLELTGDNPPKRAPLPSAIVIFGPDDI